MQKEFEEAAFALQPNEISGIVDTASGLHLIQRYGYYPLSPQYDEANSPHFRFLDSSKLKGWGLGRTRPHGEEGEKDSVKNLHRLTNFRRYAGYGDRP